MVRHSIQVVEWGNPSIHPIKDITLITHLSIDRIDRLETQIASWNGPVSAAIYVPKHIPDSHIAFEVIEQKLKLNQPRKYSFWKSLRKTNPRNIIISLVRIHPNDLDIDEDGYPYYPINVVRNIALEAAKTELVVLADVDLICSSNMYESLCSKLKSLLSTCCQSKVLWVIPAFEFKEAAIQENTNLISMSSTPLRTSKLLQLWKEGIVEQFAVHIYPKGHNSTDYKRWISNQQLQMKSLMPLKRQIYKVEFEEGYEPWVLGARILLPRFDERFHGYGNNKISFLYYCFYSGFIFKCGIPDAFFVHRLHSRSSDSMRTYGEQRKIGRREKIDELYMNFKIEQLSRRVLFGWNDIIRRFEEDSSFLSLRKRSKSPIRASRQHRKIQQRDHTVNCSVGDVPPETIDFISKYPFRQQNLYMAHILERHSEFNYPSVKILVCHLRSGDTVEASSFKSFSRRSIPTHISESITLVTHCSLDRLDRLHRILRNWSGEVSVSLFIRDIPEFVGFNVRSVFPDGISTHDISISLVMMSESENRSLYPLNIMRNVAILASKSHLLFLIDIDFAPCPSFLNTVLGDYEYLKTVCFQELGVAVIPALEYSSSQNGRFPNSKDDVKKLVYSGKMRAFHEKSFFKGHQATDLRKFLWIESHYVVKYEMGYEPYVICSRKNIPPFAVHFVGYGRDKISWTYHLQTRGFKFFVYNKPDSFLIASPHEESSEATRYKLQENFKLQERLVSGLFMRFKSDIKVMDNWSSLCEIEDSEQLMLQGSENFWQDDFNYSILHGVTNPKKQIQFMKFHWAFKGSCGLIENCFIEEDAHSETCHLRVFLAKGTVSPIQSVELVGVVGGVSLKADPNSLSTRALKFRHLGFSFNVLLPHDFDWASGGRLPGFYLDNEWELGFRWMPQGKIKLEFRESSQGKWKYTAFCGIGGSLVVDHWQELALVLHRDSASQISVKAWLNAQLIVGSILCRTDSGATGALASGPALICHYGGVDRESASDRDNHVYFRNVRIWN